VSNNFEAVVVGVSAGGMKALKVVLGGLQETYSLPVIIVQHRHASTDNFLISYLDQRSKKEVKEAEEKEKIRENTVYIAPADYHLLIERDRTFSLSVDEQVCYARPSVDVLFESAAYVYGRKLIAIVLTGANSDGAQGLKKIKTFGGMTIAQNPESAESPVMPQAAIDTGAVDFVLELEEIPGFLQDLVEEENDYTG
jgi:two-component system chemotaxis response regulator CheB